MMAGVMTKRDQWAFVVFSTWSVVGLFLDGWSHRHDKPESFFTPYHGVLYSGVAAAVLWTLLETRRRQEQSTLFAGGRLTAMGLALFGVGGGADFVWHEVFGIEADTEALLSPTHLLLFTGGLLLTTGPMRAAWTTDPDEAPSFVDFLPRLVGLSLATAIVAFFTQFLHPFLLKDLEAGDGADYAIAGLFVSTVVLVAPLLLARRRWRLPPGTCTFHLVAVTLLVLSLEAFERPAILVAALAAGLAGDLVASRPRLLGVVVPVVLWSGFFAVAAVTDGLHWAVELWSGSIVVAGLGGYGLALLAFPPETGPEIGERPPKGPL